MIDKLKKIKSRCNLNITDSSKMPNHRLVREFNKGKSFRISKWERAITYLNDDFIQDWVTFENVILICIKSHTSEIAPELIYENSKVIGVNSSYWEIAISNSISGIENGQSEGSAILVNSKGIAAGKFSSALGSDNIFGENIPNEGDKLEYVTAIGYASHAEGAAHAIGDYSHAEGGGNTDVRGEGYKVVSTAEGECSHAEGTHTHAKGGSSHAEGNRSKAIGAASHAEGRQTVAEGVASHVEGFNTKTGGTTDVNNRELGSHTSSGAYAHAEGNATIAKGVGAHSEGTKTIAIGNDAHSEGRDTIAKGYRSHAEGKSTESEGRSSHAEGEYTQTKNIAEHAEGKYNRSTKDKTLHSVGIGISESKRKNAHEITFDGKHYILDIGDYDGTNLNTAIDLATLLKSPITDKELDELFND